MHNLLNKSAHVIREPSKSFAKSVCALKARNRWAVTGTPIQNRLTDLFSLFKFLRCYPFDDLKVFNTHVTQNWKARSDPICVAKLKALVNSVSIRRPKTIIELLGRKDEVIYLEFSEQERQYYQEVLTSTRHKIDSAVRESSNATFLNALKWVNELRLICNHGIVNKKSIQTLEEAPTPRPTICAQEAQTRFDQLDAIGLARCSNHFCSQDLGSALSSETDTEHHDEPRIDEWLRLWCSSCFHNTVESASKIFKICNHLPRRCTKLNNSIPELGICIPPEDKNFVFDQDKYIPSKIQRLLQDLCETPDDVKRFVGQWNDLCNLLTCFNHSVVFSSWTKTFDIIQPQLCKKAIRCVRLDGSLSASGRANVLRVFRNEPGIKVLLATISCGGIGLDLTVASRAYIMEPQWNPMSESQALDRIHRLGQLKEVQTVKYIMRESWEERVVDLQRRKQGLSDLTLGSDAANLTYGNLQYLGDIVG